MKLSQLFQSALLIFLRVTFALSTCVSAQAASVTSAAPSSAPVKPAQATPMTAYGLLDQKANRIHEENSTSGWSYIVSGTLALGVSIPAYYLSNDVFAKAVYSVTETLGVAAVGYGSYLVLLENDYTRFRNVVGSVPTLSNEQRNRLSAAFLHENADRARNVRKIRVISHSLTGALNFVNGATASQPELKTAMYFLGAINTLAALSFAFGTSEEEEMVKGITLQEIREPKFEFLLGSISGVRVRF